MSNFVLKVFKWIDGALHASSHECESIEHAMEHARHHGAHGFKIYDRNGVLHHAQNQPHGSTYA